MEGNGLFISFAEILPLTFAGAGKNWLSDFMSQVLRKVLDS